MTKTELDYDVSEQTKIQFIIAMNTSSTISNPDITAEQSMTSLPRPNFDSIESISRLAAQDDSPIHSPIKMSGSTTLRFDHHGSPIVVRSVPRAPGAPLRSRGVRRIPRSAIRTFQVRKPLSERLAQANCDISVLLLWEPQSGN